MVGYTVQKQRATIICENIQPLTMACNDSVLLIMACINSSTEKPNLQFPMSKARFQTRRCWAR